MHVSRPVYRVRVTAPFEVRLYVEKYLPDAHGVPFAEILDDAPNGDFDGNVPPAVWADILVPADAKAGRYSVTIDAYVCVGATNERLAAHRELTLEVYPCALPSPRDYTIYLDLWQHNSNLARYYGTELWSDEHFAVMEKAVKTLAELGQKSVTVLLGDCPWRGWGCYLMQSTPAELYEYSMARVVKKTNGNFSYDFSAVERYVNLCEKYGMTGDISVYGLLGIWKMPYFPAAQVQHAEQVLIRYLDETDGAYRYIEKENDLAAYLAAALTFSKQRVGLKNADQRRRAVGYDRLSQEHGLLKYRA
ncbi:MAG: glycoside hydrolase domain-containing protein [Christensenellaceae bacterium]